MLRRYKRECKERMKEKKRKENGKKEGSRFIGRVLLSMLPP